MKIVNIKTTNHDILGDIELNFCNSVGTVCDNIIFAGENGCGKTSILNLIYEFSQFQVIKKENVILEFSVLINDEEKEIINSSGDLSRFLKDKKIESLIKFTFDTINNNSDKWEQCTCLVNVEGSLEKIPGVYFAQVGQLFRGFFSDAEISFNPSKLNSVTSKNLDTELNKNIKSSPNLATEIKQLLIDIQTLDDNEMGMWARYNPGKIMPEELIDIRTNRFRKAFNSFIQSKKFKGITNFDNNKQVVFEENGKDIYLEQLSSGEKQIVFRGGFCLKDKNNIDNFLVLIDEPEISLHPIWQQKIVVFYRDIFSNHMGKQTSQIFIATHSPFIIHNDKRINDKVIVLKKREDGKISVSDSPQFYGWTENKMVEEAFNIKTFLGNKSLEKSEHIIITEGKTDWKHLKKAFHALKEELSIEFDLNFYEYNDEIVMGNQMLLSICDNLSRLNVNKKIICIFDRDDDNVLNKIGVYPYKNWGNNVFSVVLPVPAHRIDTPHISIEHYYLNDEIITVDLNGRRLYLGSEFSNKTGINSTSEKICIEKNKLGATSIKIIDNNVYLINNENENIALSKSDFSNYVLNDIEPYNMFDFSSFKSLLDVIVNIISEN